LPNFPTEGGQLTVLAASADGIFTLQKAGPIIWQRGMGSLSGVGAVIQIISADDAQVGMRTPPHCYHCYHGAAIAAAFCRGAAAQRPS